MDKRRFIVMKYKIGRIIYVPIRFLDILFKILCFPLERAHWLISAILVGGPIGAGACFYYRNWTKPWLILLIIFVVFMFFMLVSMVLGDIMQGISITLSDYVFAKKADKIFEECNIKSIQADLRLHRKPYNTWKDYLRYNTNVDPRLRIKD